MIAGVAQIYWPWILLLLIFLTHEYVLSNRVVAMGRRIESAGFIIAIEGLVGLAGLALATVSPSFVALASSWQLPLKIFGYLLATSSLLLSIYWIPAVPVRANVGFALVKQLGLTGICLDAALTFAVTAPIKTGLYALTGFFALPIVISALTFTIALLLFLVLLPFRLLIGAVRRHRVAVSGRKKAIRPEVRGLPLARPSTSPGSLTSTHPDVLDTAMNAILTGGVFYDNMESMLHSMHDGQIWDASEHALIAAVAFSLLTKMGMRASRSAMSSVRNRSRHI